MPALSRTMATLRLLRQIGPKTYGRRGGRLPRQQQPDGIRLAYFASIMPLIREQTKYLAAAGRMALRMLTEERSDDARLDISERKRMVEQEVARAARHATEAFRPKALEHVAEQFGKRTSEFNRQQLDRQVRQAIGVPLVSIEKPIRDMIPVFAKANVELIKTVPDRYHDRLAKDVQAAFESGEHPETFARRLVELEDISENDARRIARDQIGKLASEFNRERMESIGIKRARWRTMNDGRVRDEHQEYEGQEYDIDEGIDGILPGEEIQCFPFDTPVRLHDSTIRKAFRHRYRGKLATIVTASGESLSATPNHPILTGRGWIPAHLVDVGDYVFKAPDQVFDVLVGDPQRRDSMIGEVFGACASVLDTQRIAGAAPWFHGDMTDEQVDVVDVERGLRFELDPAVSQDFCQNLLARSNDSLFALSSAYLHLLSSGNAPRGVMSGAGKLLTFIGSHLSVPLDHRLGAITRLDAIANELGTDGSTRDAEAFRECLNAQPVSMERRNHVARVVLGAWRRAVMNSTRLDATSAKELGETVSIAVERPGRLGDRHAVLNKPLAVVQKSLSEPCVTHVFNLETLSQWYVTTNLIVHNCRCYDEPIFDDLISGL